MDIRRLTPADAAAYRALRIRALWEYPEAFTSSYEEEEAKPVEESAKRLASPHHIFWGLFDGNHLGGMVGLEREPRAKNRHKATVIGMYIAMEHAGVGMGRKLFDVVLAEAKREGIELLVLTVTDGNGAATHLYESLGFRSFGVEPKAIKVDERYFGKRHMYMDLTQQPS